MKPIALAVAALSVVAIPTQAGTLESRVDEIRERLDVPGLSVSAVHRGEIVLMHGSGVRRAGTEDPVTPRTRFALASITKSLTALALASAVASWGWSTRSPAPTRVISCPRDPEIARDLRASEAGRTDFLDVAQAAATASDALASGLCRPITSTTAAPLAQ